MAAGREPRTEDDDILTGSIGPGQDITQVMQSVRAADGQTVEGETPDDTKRVQRCQNVEVAAAENDGQNLQERNEMDGPVTAAVFLVRALKPGGEDACFAKPVEYTICAKDGSIGGS